ncbi:Cysteine--tRNA ligase [Roseovarius tolerans]|uniref:Cysteine--tRNA ligase n=1 Tax=Roseovarius tolerans TaxID=74031 RepID=A0A0L6CXJ6_9RHOB|nr:cysteine--tRNA ligase [Roseovarius tolerans]KNX42464.1 Cysteine--tRNA ligase [Roseovarius tolerans]
MTTIKLHNTRTRKKEEFAPLDPENVRMYVCGPTVYDRAHLGNARPVVVFDVLYRLLRHVYGPDHVTYVRNFTDVDDKINARAAESGRAIGEITAETTQWFLDDMAELGALEPDHMPRATQYIPQMVAMIEDLIAKGHAYEAEGHVLFAVDSWREGYGKLSGRTVDDMIAGSRVEVAPYKRNPMDFVLWKPSDEGQPGWESPWGRGRPGWHIECSAMAYELLGESFDIHGGGNDLMFPHHENEIAQSCCAHPEGQFARYWLHNEMLQVEGKKMSKSLGNFFTVRDLLETGMPGNKGVPGPVIRYVFLLTNYRKPMDWRQASAVLAKRRLDIWASEVAHQDHLRSELNSDVEAFIRSYVDQNIVDALCDDLNTSLAITHLISLAKSLEGSSRAKLSSDQVEQANKRLLAGCALLGINLFSYGDFEDGVMLHPTLSDEVIRERIVSLVWERQDAKKSKDFGRADEIRDALTKAGVVVVDTPQGPEWDVGPDFDPAKLEALK